MQNGTGGFGGGHGQMSHCASSYALTLSLAMVGGPEAFSLVDRLAWLVLCTVPSLFVFCVRANARQLEMAGTVEAGRRGVSGQRGRRRGCPVGPRPPFSLLLLLLLLPANLPRGAYCAMVMIALLDIPLELPPDAPARQFGLDSFTSGLPEYLSRCTSIRIPIYKCIYKCKANRTRPDV